ncbi:hypothetical protein ACFFTM_04650 [Pseudoduganella plicata]|uniref:Uncharacterized protein n=1 Tax=Pseudoduganella plicata TaxID=321984 RepID=A0A4P7BKL3_9BURK|nr:hypothetical protein [Pseudoduganella plicata]QBQ38822.1 hypothetical protein E1742_23635 [Pseudoduganella plicata]GGY85360.1 hypothetical protein GCM10007388_18280 [Pseudoduganella plicata]
MGRHVTLLRADGGMPQPIEPDEIVRALQRIGSPYVLAPDARADARLVDPTTPDDTEVMFLQAGELWASNPGPTLLALMLDLARELGARVRDDELQTYRTVGETYVHPDDIELLARLPQQAQAGPPRRATGALVPICIGALLGILLLLLRR